MDNQSPTARIERTLWTVWSYITGAVNRFFRSEPTDVIRNEANTLQESDVDHDPAPSGQEEEDTSRGQLDEEQLLSRVPVLVLSRPVVGWEPSASDISLESEEDENSEDVEGTREEPLVTTGNDAEYAKEDKEEEEEEEEEEEVGKLATHGQDEMQENDDCDGSVNAWVIGAATLEGMEKQESKMLTQEETEKATTLDDQNKRSVSVTEREINERQENPALTGEDTGMKLHTIATLSLADECHIYVEELRVQEEMSHDEVEESDVILLPATTSDNESGAEEGHLSGDRGAVKSDEGFSSPQNEAEMVRERSGFKSEDEITGAGLEQVMEHREESDEVEEEEVERTVEEDEEDLELHMAEFNYGEQVDAAEDAEEYSEKEQRDDVGTKSHVEMIDGNSHVSTDIPTEERFADQNEVEEERPFSEVGHNDYSTEVTCTATSVTVKPEVETGQETSGEFKNMPPRTSEGLGVVSLEQHSTAGEETQEGVPEYNNEPGPNENTTQRFLEAGDSEEIKVETTRLPEEVGSKDCEGFENSGANYSLLTELMEKGEERTEDIETSLEAFGIKSLTGAETAFVEPLEDEGHLVDDSMKTGFENSEGEFEKHGLLFTDEAEKTTTELQDESEEMNEVQCISKKADAVAVEDEARVVADGSLRLLEAEVQMTEMSFNVDSVDVINLEQNNFKTHSLLEDVTESELLKLPVGGENSVVDDTGIDMEETGCGVEDEAGDDDTCSKNQLETFILEAETMAAELTTESILRTESLETESQLSDEAQEISVEEAATSDESATSDFKPEDVTVEEIPQPVGGHQDVIDEEILDLWLETALSGETDGLKQDEGLVLGEQMDLEMEPSTEELNEVPAVLTETSEEYLLNSKADESKLVSDTEISLTMESGVLDQFLCESDEETSETQLERSTSIGSFQDVYDMLASTSQSAEFSRDQQPHTESQETSEKHQSHQKELESTTEDKTKERNNEESASQQETDPVMKTDSSNADEADVKSSTELSASFESEQTKDEDVEMNISGSPGESEHTDSERSRSGSVDSLVEETALSESGSQDDTSFESEEKPSELLSVDKPQPTLLEDISDSSPEPDEEETRQDLMEVDASLLDFSPQKSRIAVKNPRVRPPKDPRSLLHMPSLDPLPSSRLAAKAPAGVPLGGMGIGIKLPGFGAGFPVLKKTRPVARDENHQETPSQETETKPEEKSDTPKQDEAQHKPRWMPPRHPGFGNPLMSELKTKLKKTTKE
ncbi:uncharacterized protein V6R79_009441 [Siganus canaliculatus]